MLYLFVSSKPSARERVHTHMNKVMGDDIPTRITAEEIGECDIEALALSQGLFTSSLSFFFDSAFGDKTTRERIAQHAALLAKSVNHFFVLEDALDAPTLKALQKHATLADIDKETEAKERPGGFFSVSDALGARDRKKLWVEIVRARALGAASEEIHGVLWWGVKNMVLAREAKTPQEVGLNPFVFKKAKLYTSNFTGEELQQLADEVSTLLYRARRRNIDSGIALERFALSI